MGSILANLVDLMPISQLFIGTDLIRKAVNQSCVQAFFHKWIKILLLEIE